MKVPMDGISKKNCRLTQRDIDLAVQELSKHFLDDCSHGTFQVGQFLPSPRLLAEKYQVTFSTARNLYTKLKQKGFIKSLARKGTMLSSFPDPEALFRRDLIHSGLTVIGVLDYVNPNAILNSAMVQLRVIDDLCNQNKIISRFYNLHKNMEQILSSDRIYITKEDISALKKNHSAGYIVLGATQIACEENWKQLKKLKEPVILINQESSFPGINTISADEVASGYIATSHLLKLKHQKIAFLGYDLPEKWQDERIIGYREALAECGLTSIERWSHFFTYRNTENLVQECRESVFHEAATIMKTCTAAICASEALAVLMLQYAYQHKIQPISLVSFDNQWKFRSWELTSVQYPFFEIATAAFQQIQLMKEKQEANTLCLKLPGILYRRLSSFKCENPC